MAVNASSTAAFVTISRIMLVLLLAVKLLILSGGIEADRVEAWVDGIQACNAEREWVGLPRRRTLLVLDADSSPTITRSEYMLRQIVLSKRENVSVWITTQQVYNFDPVIRYNIDFFVLFRENNNRALKEMKKMFSIMGSDFEAVYKKHTMRSRKRFDGESEYSYDQVCPPRAVCIDNEKMGSAETWHECVYRISAGPIQTDKPWMRPTEKSEMSATTKGPYCVNIRFDANYYIVRT